MPKRKAGTASDLQYLQIEIRILQIAVLLNRETSVINVWGHANLLRQPDSLT